MSGTSLVRTYYLKYAVVIMISREIHVDIMCHVMCLLDQVPGVYITTEAGPSERSHHVVVGTSFEVLCSSSGEYRGNVTWIMKDSEGTAVL